MKKLIMLLRHPLTPGAILLLAVIVLVVAARVDLRRGVPRLPKRVSAETVAILEIDLETRGGTIAQVLETTFPDLRALHEKVLGETKINLATEAAPILEHASYILVSKQDNQTHLTIIAPRDQNLRRDFETTVARILSRLYLSHRPIFLQDQSFISEEVADPKEFPFYPIAVSGASPRVLQKPGAPQFADLDDGSRIFMASNFQDLRAILGALGAETITPNRFRFACVIPAPGIKLRLRKDVFSLKSTKNPLSYQIYEGNRLVLPSISLCP